MVALAFYSHARLNSFGYTSPSLLICDPAALCWHGGASLVLASFYAL